MPLLCATNQGRLASLQVLPPSGADTSGTRTATPSSGTDPRGTGAGRARRRCSPFSGHDGGQAAYARNSAEQFGVADEQKPVATPDRRVSMPDERRRVTLTKAQCESPVARDLIVLLTELSADGVVSRDELQQLRAWLEVDRGVDFPALSFLYETIDQISADGEITEDELDLLALAIERVLPKDVQGGRGNQAQGGSAAATSRSTRGGPSDDDRAARGEADLDVCEHWRAVMDGGGWRSPA